MIYLDSF